MRIWAVLAVAISWSAVAQAASVDFADIPAGAKWFAHADVDAMRDSTLVERAYYQVIQEHPQAEGHFDQVEAVSGMDVRQDLHSLTFYGTKIAPDGVVLIVKADFDKARLEEKAKEAPNHQVSEYGDWKIHTWTHDKGKGGEREVAGAFFKSDVLTFGSSVDEVKKALDLLSGKGDSLAKEDSALTADVPAGATFVARVVGLAGAKLPTKSPALQKTKRISIAMGEHEGKAFFKGELVAEDQDTARQVKEIVEGGRAMITLQYGDDADAKALLNALEVQLSDKEVSVAISAGVEHIWQAAKKGRAEMEKHQKAHKNNKKKDKKEG